MSDCSQHPATRRKAYWLKLERDMKRQGYIAFDTAGYATRSYIAKRAADAQRAAEMEMGDSLGRVRKFPLNVVLYPMQDDRHLEPADLTKNSGWGELSPFGA